MGCSHGAPDGNVCAACEMEARSWPGDAVGRVFSIIAPDPRGDAWRHQPRREHLAAALRHIAAELDGETEDKHSGRPPLEHAAARLLMACETKEEER